MKNRLKQLKQLLIRSGQLRKYGGWLVKQARPVWPSLALMTAVDLLAMLIAFGSSFVSKSVVDTAASGQPFTHAFVVMILLTALSIVIGAAAGGAAALIREHFSFDVRLKMFDRILSADYLGLTRFHSGDLLTRLTSDADTVANSIASAIPNLIMIFFRLIAAFALLYGFSPFLAFSAVLLAPAGLIISLAAGEELKNLTAEVRKTEAEYRSFLQERAVHLSVVKSFCAESESRRKLQAHRQRTLSAMMRHNKLGIVTGTLVRCFFFLGYLLSFGYCLLGLYSGSITYGTMTLFLSLFSQIQQPLMSLSHLLPQAVGIIASAGRLMELEDIPEDPRSGASSRPDEVALHFCDVSFSYDRAPVLRNVSFTAQPRQLTGIMGPSGAGKTTLIRLVLSLIHPSAGQAIFQYGDTQEPLSGDSRRLIAYVPQGNTLFSGTIRDNLLLGNPDATEENMLRALEDADAGFVRALPLGLNTPIGEKATGLSEGQAQRIAIARAFLRRTPVLILDEATSALDEKSEQRILSRLCAPDRSWSPLCLIVTHRRSMLPYFDQLLEIREDGHIAITHPGASCGNLP